MIDPLKFRLSLCFVGIALVLAGEAIANNRTIKRVDDPVVVSCAKFGTLLGCSIERLCVMSLRDGRWSPIPFQVDQKKPDGNYAFTSGPESSRDPDPNLDADDELVFMVKDTGDAVLGATDLEWPDAVDAAFEITVIDPKNGSRGWAYLLRFPGDAPKSDEDYIQLEIDEKSGYRGARSYEYRMGGPLDTPLPDCIAATVVPSGEEGLDILDRMKIRGKLTLPVGAQLPFVADEIIKSKDAGYIDGPVRVLHHAYGYMRVIGSDYVGTGYSTLSYYPAFVICPLSIKVAERIPRWVLSLFPRISICGYLDFNTNIYGSHIFSAANRYRPDIVLDGKTSAAERAIDKDTRIDWIAGFGPLGGIVSRLTLPESAAPYANQVTFYADDISQEDFPEDHPGLSAVGFNVISKKWKVAKIIAEGTFYLYIFAKSDLCPENIQSVLDILDYPIEAQVREVTVNNRRRPQTGN